MPSYLVTFTVKGLGPFPIDMLRYDCCYPASAEDAVKIMSRTSEPREITLKTHRAVSKTFLKLQIDDQKLPAVGRWKSFQWEISRSPSISPVSPL